VPASSILQFIEEEEGISFAEYALLGALISVVCVLTVTAVGLSTLDLYTVVCSAVAAAMNMPAC
jgi:Flp pilus assembly pilin Flp